MGKKVGCLLVTVIYSPVILSLTDNCVFCIYLQVVYSIIYVFQILNPISLPFRLLD